MARTALLLAVVACLAACAAGEPPPRLLEALPRV